LQGNIDTGFLLRYDPKERSRSLMSEPASISRLL
jgi:hypothetical protein